MSVFWYFVIAFLVIGITLSLLKSKRIEKEIEEREPSLPLWEERFPGKTETIHEYLKYYCECFELPDHFWDRVSPDDSLRFFDEKTLSWWQMDIDAMEDVDFLMELERRTGKEMPEEVARDAGTIGAYFDFFYGTDTES